MMGVIIIIICYLVSELGKHTLLTLSIRLKPTGFARMMKTAPAMGGRAARRAGTERDGSCRRNGAGGKGRRARHTVAGRRRMRHGKGKPMKSKTSAADATPTEQRAPNAPTVRFSLDYLIVIAGFGLCRAWIVFSLSASVSSFEARTDWVFLVAGAVAAALAALVMTRFVGSMPRMHERLTDIMLGLAASSALCIPAATWLDSASLLMLGLITGGAAAGLLQVMWGERFAAQDLYFSLACAPAAAVVTGLVLAMASDGNLIAFIALPAASIVLLALECRRCGIVLEDGPAGRPDGATTPQEADEAERPRRRAGEPPSRAGARCTAGPSPRRLLHEAHGVHHGVLVPHPHAGCLPHRRRRPLRTFGRDRVVQPGRGGSRVPRDRGLRQGPHEHHAGLPAFAAGDDRRADSAGARVRRAGALGRAAHRNGLRAVRHSGMGAVRRDRSAHGAGRRAVRVRRGRGLSCSWAWPRATWRAPS